MALYPPYYLLEERLLRRNLQLISSVSQRSGAEIILAFKAYALWKTFPIFREYINATTASSADEARLALEEFGSKAHTYSPAYTDRDFDTIVSCSSHITFNSLTQYQRFGKPLIATPAASHPSLGLRVNPEYSEIETELYNPCAPGSRFGVLASDLPQRLPDGIEGFHIHCHCESSAETFVRTLAHIEDKFARWFPQLKWINFGGGHLMTRKDYNVELLIQTISDFRNRYPHLKVILEPGSAFGWQTGDLIASVVDIVENHNIKTAILDVSFTCHMPDCLEMPYMPAVSGADGEEAQILPLNTASDDSLHTTSQGFAYRLGGNSCLSGDFMGTWLFNHELQIGEQLTFADMLHYTTVKTNTFNGVHHPSIAIRRLDGTIEILREYTYEDYRDRMD
ncbi:MAG: carboxynorspermidine decarboxylase [Bacteroidaceae bacterium]|nr:carboxynorspermidine decarboxylase [Bacteroidaceae bacterium]